MKEKTATFIGHNVCYGLKKKEIENAIRGLLDKGVTNFLLANTGGFDRTCVQLLYSLKTEFPHIAVQILISEEETKTLKQKILDRTTAKKYTDSINLCYHYAIDKAAYAVCFINHSWGEAARVFRYAQKKDIKLINLAEKI